MATEAGYPPSAGLAATASVHSDPPVTRLDVEALKAIAVLCGIGLTVSLLFATNGLDLSVGFF